MHGHFNHCIHSLHQPVAHSCLMHGCPKLFQFTHPCAWVSCKPFPHPTHLHSSHMLCFKCPHAISLTTRGYTSPMISTSMISTLFTSMCMPSLPISLYTTTIPISCTFMHMLTPTKALKPTSSLFTPSNHPNPHSDYG